MAKYEASLLTHARVVVCVHRTHVGMAVDVQRGLHDFRSVAFMSSLSDRTPMANADVLIVSGRTVSTHSAQAAHLLDQLNSPGLIVLHNHFDEWDDFERPDVAVFRECSTAKLRATAFRVAEYCGRRRLANEILLQLGRDGVAKIFEVVALRDKPPLTVSEAATFCGIDRSNAAHEWNVRGQAAYPHYQLKNALDWVLLARVLLVKTPSVGWTEASSLIGLARPRLDRMARRLISVPVTAILDSDEWRKACPFKSIRDFGGGLTQPKPTLDS